MKKLFNLIKSWFSCKKEYPEVDEIADINVCENCLTMFTVRNKRHRFCSRECYRHNYYMTKNK